MTQIDEDARRERYFAGVASRVEPHLARSFQYEKEAIEYSKSAFTAVTYLNGGGLLAMPTAVAMFHANLEKITPLLVHSASYFILGLLCVVGAQGCAFFTMARRAESQQLLSNEQQGLLGVTIYPDRVDVKEGQATAATERALANKHIENSNVWRGIGLILYWASILFFVAACSLGAMAILSK